MNILVITSSFPANPSDTSSAPFLLDFIQILQQKGYHIHVLTQQTNKPTAPLENITVDVTHYPWKTIDKALVDIKFYNPKALISLLSLFYNSVKFLRKTIKEEKIDFAFGLWVLPAGFYLYLNHLLGNKTPFALWALGSDINKYKSFFLTRFLLKKILRSATGIFADGFDLCKSIKKISSKNCSFLPTFRKLETVNKALNTENTRAEFLYIGRHAPVKGTDVLVEAIGELKKLNPGPFHCFIGGDGALTEGLKERVQELDIQQEVTFLGRIDDATLKNYYAKSSCVIIPSRSESIPVVLSEALQFNLPLIVSDVGDMGYLMRKYEVGKVFQSEQAKELALHMKDFIETPFQIPAENQQELIHSLIMHENIEPFLSMIEQVGTGHEK